MLIKLLLLAALSLQQQYTDQDVRDAIDKSQSTMVHRIIYCEVGRSGTYDPYAIGSSGEIGPGQLLPGPSNGLAIFYRLGWTDPYNPYQVVEWLEYLEQRPSMLAQQYPLTRLGCRGSP